MLANSSSSCIASRGLDASNDGQDFDHEHRLLMPDGPTEDVHVPAHAVEDTSGGVEFVEARTDITSAQPTEGQPNKTQAEIAHIMRMTTLGELTASIAHEVNQPLAAIVSAAVACQRWLNRGTPNLDEACRAAQWIAEEGHRMSEVVQRVRALANKTVAKKAPVHINNVIEEVMPLVRYEVLTHNVSLRLELGSTLPPVLGNRVELQQVIINLLVNGIQAMSSVIGPRELLIRSRRHEPDQILVAVEDSGIGIEPENIDRLFNTFFTTKPDGIGIGLSICRSIIERHDGRIWAAPKAGTGSTFQFTLPACQEAAS
jgi:C4-dicarboxylate-specific signal transduction histidine kinase